MIRNVIYPFVLLFFLIQFPGNAQERFQFDANLSYQGSIQSPAEFLGYEPGEHFTFHHKVMDYFKYLDENSEKLTFHKYAETYEGRGLYYALITSEVNQSDIEAIKRENKRLSNPDELNDTMAEMLLKNQPVIVWLSYNVHGNEASSSEAAMQTAYRMVAAQDNETQAMLDGTVVIIDPMLNPDGRDRYVYYYKTARSGILNKDAFDLEHDEPWPGGRTNHYWFDLNRDWTWLVHPESRGRIEVYQEWMPQVHLDLHEQGFNSNYFTMPGTTPRNHLLPDDYEKWAEAFGNGVIEEFDKHNINYATREAFDFFYPGYGSSYPSLMGAIGMLAEQGGHSRGGRAVETEDGYVLTLRQRIFDHYTNSIATIRTAVNNREALLNYFRSFFMENSQKNETKTYFLADNPNDYTYELLNILLQHGVEIERLSESLQMDVNNYWNDRPSKKQFKAGDFVIKMDQPKRTFINTLLKKQMTFKDSVMYDMSTWSAPMAYDVDAYWTQDNINQQTITVNEPLTYPSGVENKEAKYAYVIDWKQRYAPNALAELWDRGYRVRTAVKSFTKAGQTYSRGSIIVLIGRNYDKKTTIAEDMQAIADNKQVLIKGFDTGRMDDGIDLASRSSEPVEKPKVALLTDSPVNSYTAGQIWFLMEQWTDFGISRLRMDAFKNINIDEYNVIIIPDTWGPLSVELDSVQISRLKGWVTRGGTLIASGNSALYFTNKASGFTNLELTKAENNNSDKETDKIDPSAYTRFEARVDSSGLKRVPGTALRGFLDTSHPLAFGLDEKTYVLKFDNDAIVPSTSWQLVGYYDKNPDEILRSGYISRENKKKLSGHAFAGVQPTGSGNVIFLVDNTQYRMFWVGTARLMQNAVLLMPGM